MLTLCLVTSCVSVHPEANDAPRVAACRADTFSVDARTLQIEVDTFPAPVDEDDADARAWNEVKKILRPRLGVAFVQVGVDARGDVACLSLDRSAGDRRVDHAALRAASRIAWKSAVMDGKTSDGFVNIAVRSYARDDEACARDFAWACHAEAHRSDDDALFAKACALGDVHACTDVGKRTGDRALLETSCTRDADACVALGGTEMLERACAMKSGEGCRLLAAQVDDVRALALLELACAQRDVEACARAGQRLIEGRGTAVDEVRGAMLQARARRRGWK
jgi:hypothetical protein